MKIISKLQQGGKPNQFIDNWNQARLTTGRFNNQLGNGNLEEQKANRDSAPIYKSPIAYGFNSYIKATPLINSKSNPKTQEELELERKKNALQYGRATKARMIAPDSQGIEGAVVRGEYNPNAHTIYAPTEDVELHEQAHASKAFPQEEAIKGILGGENNAGTQYYDRPTEVYSRLMELRNANNIDPNKEWTEDEIKALRKTGTDFDILNRYKPKQVLRLFNEVAQVPTTNDKALFAQEGAVLKQDNTRVYRQPIFLPQKVQPRQDQLIDLGGTPSTDTRTAAERNQDYWHPIKGAKERFKSSMKNETNPLVGLERTVMPAMAGAALVTTPATVIGGVLGSEAVNSATGGFGKWLENKTGVPRELGEYLNPGAIYGGAKGLNISRNRLASKFIKGDADLGWNALNKDHWIFNREARTPTNMAMATVNRVMPFLSNAEKTPARIAAYKIGRRTKGNASVSLKDIKNNESTYTGSATPEGNNGDRDLLGLYLFQNDPLISKSPWFQKVASSFKPAKGNGFSYDSRYSELYPGIEGRRYQMQSVIKNTRPLRFRNIDEFNDYSKGIGKLQGKEGDMVIEMPDGFQTFRQPGTNYVGPIDDVGGHIIKIDFNKRGKLTQVSQDMWKFNPRDYSKRWSGKGIAEAVRANKQAALMDKVGTPFILQQENPIYIGARRVWEDLQSIPDIVKQRRQPLMQGTLLTMKRGGSLTSDGRRFKFKDSTLVKNSRSLNNKRDMRRKFIKSDRPTYSNNRIRKGQNGLQFVSYTPVEEPSIDMSMEIPSKNAFSPYNIPITKDEIPITKTPVEEVPTEVEPVKEKKKSMWTNNYSTNKKKWIEDLTNAYKKAGVTNQNTLHMLISQDALESGWGKSAQGDYNFGNITAGKYWKGRTVQGRDKNAKGERISQVFRAYDSIDDYAKDKIDFLRRLYDFNEEDDIDTFANKLQGGNKGKRKYAEAPNYIDLLKKVYRG